MNKKLKVLICIVVFTSSLFVFFASTSLYQTIHDNKLYERDFCLSSQCLDNFAKEVSGIALYFQAFGYLITTFVTVFGVIIALMTYYSGVKNNNNSNYTAHLTMFREFSSAELAKRTSIYPEGVNLFRWYRVMFPKAKDGDISVSNNYLSIINGIQNVINEANAHITDENKDYKYKAHQRKMITVLSEMGIRISNAPKNTFIDIERQVFEYIDTVNLSFSHQVVELSKIERKYI